MISNCGKDERGKYTGGQAGDQTGKEWEIREWYNRPWNCILRHPDERVREMLADFAEKAAKNNNIGYDQYQRLTYYNALERSDFDPANIAVKCETDCSAGISANAKAVGHKLGIDALKSIDPNCYTGNMKKNFSKAGFKVLTAKKYLTSPDYLLRGDILLNEASHTATNLTDGKFVSKIQNEDPKKSVEDIAKEVIAGKWGNGTDREKKLAAAGYDFKTVQSKVNELIAKDKKPSAPTYESYIVTGVSSYLNVRKSPNGAVVGKLYNGNRVEVVSISNGWAKLSNGNYIFSKYIKKV